MKKLLTITRLESNSHGHPEDSKTWIEGYFEHAEHPIEQAFQNNSFLYRYDYKLHEKEYVKECIIFLLNEALPVGIDAEIVFESEHMFEQYYEWLQKITY